MLELVQVCCVTQPCDMRRGMSSSLESTYVHEHCAGNCSHHVFPNMILAGGITTRGSWFQLMLLVQRRLSLGFQVSIKRSSGACTLALFP